MSDIKGKSLKIVDQWVFELNTDKNSLNMDIALKI